MATKRLLPENVNALLLATRRLLSENVNALLFIAGFVSFVWGMSAWSVPLAAVVAGGLVMGMAAAPYVRRRKGE